MSKHLIALYKDSARASTAVDRLRAAGFPQESIGAALSERTREALKRDKTPEAIEGGLVALAAIVAAVPIFLVPGLGLLVAGPLFALLAGGALAAGPKLSHALGRAGLSEADADAYERHLAEGGVVLTLEAMQPEVQRRGREILATAGAERVDIVDVSTKKDTHRAELR
jgi:hypothetical protein